MLPTLSPIPLKERVSAVSVERGLLDMLDGAFIVVDRSGVRTHIPAGDVGCMMREPSSRVFMRRSPSLGVVERDGLRIPRSKRAPGQRSKVRGGPGAWSGGVEAGPPRRTVQTSGAAPG